MQGIERADWPILLQCVVSAVAELGRVTRTDDCRCAQELDAPGARPHLSAAGARSACLQRPLADPSAGASTAVMPSARVERKPEETYIGWVKPVATAKPRRNGLKTEEQPEEKKRLGVWRKNECYRVTDQDKGDVSVKV